MYYKLVICGEKFYHEIELTDETDSFRIGTYRKCKIRINKAIAKKDFEIDICRENAIWKVKNLGMITFKATDKIEQEEYSFKVGEKLGIYMEGIEHELFFMDFYPDYPIKNTNYDLKIDCSNYNEFTIGGTNCNIQITDPLVRDDVIHVAKATHGFRMDFRRCKCGVSINGIPCGDKCIWLDDKDFFALKGYQFFIFCGAIFTTNDGSIVTNMSFIKVEYERNHYSYPKFIKNCRQLFSSPTEEIEVLEPKALSAAPERNIMQSMLPALLSVVLIIICRGGMSGRTGNSTGSPFIYYSIGMMLVGIIGSVMAYSHDNKKYLKEKSHRENVYRKYLEEQESKIIELRNKEHAIACHQSQTVLQDVERVASFDSRLFEKKKEHEDYLVVNLGKGVVETKCPVQYKKKEFMDTDDYLMEYPESIHDKYKYIEDMPVELDLKESNAVGFVGTRNKLYQIVKNLIINISVEHFYNDVKMFFIIDEVDVPQFAWSRWFQNNYIGDCVIRNYMYDETSTKIVLEYLYEILSERDGMTEKEVEGLPNMVVFVYRSDKISNHPIMQYVSRAAKLGFTFLFFEEYLELLNEYCQKKVFLEENENKGVIQSVTDGEQIQSFIYEHITRDVAEQVALKLGCVYVDEYSLESSLTKNISLYELLNIDSAQDLDLERRWNSSRIYESMAAPLGVKSGGEIVSLDLHEKFHGPHGLVAGTTGSGKSEILQSYILSMATLFHPYEVGFIIIDFKGGGMANQFKDLPHLNGAITNIDGKEINRSLLSIRAELNKRQQLFAKIQVNHIDEYIKAYKQGMAEVPLPHLILIVDEFAELKSEQPDFMKELISTARIGRSLGVHLILATQKPSGVVNDQIWSNSKFKLCLKVQNKQDSNEVLKSPLAAEIREPGRAYLQVGNNEIFQLFQSAYSGAPAKVNILGTTQKYKISKVLLSGQREVVFEQKIISQEDSKTQLDAIVDYVHEYFVQKGFRRLPNICLPPLPPKIFHTLDGFSRRDDAIEVPIGIYDDPNSQKQDISTINLTQNNLFILGASQMGKTNMIQMLIKGIAQLYGPEEVNFYILDFATMVLKNFESLVHVGGVATAYEDEKIRNLFKLISKQISMRKDELSDMGLSSFAAYKEAGYANMPQIILILDNVTAFKEMYAGYDEELGAICRDGVSVGITIIATNSTSSGMGLRFITYFGNRISFTCNSKSEYGTLFDRCKLEPDEVPGRAIIKLNKEFYECQTYLAFDGEREIDRTTGMKEFIEDANSRYEGRKVAERIPYIPELVTESHINSQIQDNGKNYTLAIGYNFSNTKPIYLSLIEHPMIGLYGKAQSGKSNMVRYIISTLSCNKEKYPFEMYIIDGLDKKYESYKENDSTIKYSMNPGEAIGMVKDIHAKIEKRYQMTMAGDLGFLNEEKMIVFIINSEAAYLAISEDKAVFALFKNIVKLYKGMKVCVIIPAIENAPIGFTSCDVIKCFRDDKVLFMFDNIEEQKFFDVTLAMKKQFSKKVREGEGYLLVNNELSKIKTPLCAK